MPVGTPVGEGELGDVVAGTGEGEWVLGGPGGAEVLVHAAAVSARTRTAPRLPRAARRCTLLVSCRLSIAGTLSRGGSGRPASCRKTPRTPVSVAARPTEVLFRPSTWTGRRDAGRRRRTRRC